MMAPRHPNRNSCACHDTGSNRVGKSRYPESMKVQSSIASAAQSAPNKKNALNPCEKSEGPVHWRIFSLVIMVFILWKSALF